MGSASAIASFGLRSTRRRRAGRSPGRPPGSELRQGREAARSGTAAERICDEILTALGGGPLPELELGSGPSLPSAFAVSDLAEAALAACGVQLARYIRLSRGSAPPRVRVDRELASAWFAGSLVPLGWTPPAAWDAVAGDYAGADGWIRLHTNAPHHRAAALRVLGVAADRTAVATAVAGWSVDELERAVVEAGGAAAAMRSVQQWRAHPAGAALRSEPLLWVQPTSAGPIPRRGAPSAAPLAGVRVLDLTRIIAGPVATRMLAGWGAEVLRIDPPDWDEAGLAEMLLGKRTARLDLSGAAGVETLRGLLAGADVLVHGYRADALDRLGLDAPARQAIRPGLIDVSLNAYGWSGPWVNRRGFDSLVQMSCGIAEAGGHWAGTPRPTPLPVQALDHATGYLAAGAVLSGLTSRLLTGAGSRWRASLARTAELLLSHPTTAELTARTADSTAAPGQAPAGQPAPDSPLVHTSWGDARRLAPPVEVEGFPLRWSLPARFLGSDPAAWDGTGPGGRAQ